MARAVHPNLRTAPRSHPLTTRRTGPTKDQGEPNGQVGQSVMPAPAGHPLKIIQVRQRSRSLDQG